MKYLNVVLYYTGFNILFLDFSARYPPLTDKKAAGVKFLLAKRYIPGIRYLPYMLTFGLGLVTAFALRYFTQVRKIISYLRQLLLFLFG